MSSALFNSKALRPVFDRVIKIISVQFAIYVNLNSEKMKFRLTVVYEILTGDFIVDYIDFPVPIFPGLNLL